MRRSKPAFSLIELVIVVVIIGIIAAIAIPKLSRGAAGAADSSLKGDLKVLRTALDHYAAEHGQNYPALSAITGPDGSSNVLLGYTDDQGSANLTKDATHIYGPYLRAIPPLPVGTNKNSTVITSTGPAGTTAGAAWLYNPTTGSIIANDPDADTDANGNKYNTY